MNKEEWVNEDINFMTLIINLICTYAIENNIKSDDALKAVSTNISEILKITTFNNWSKDHE